MARMRGIVGIEAAIVLIAFVLVASALAFIAINMGMFAAEKSKEVMGRAYEASTKAIDIAGNAIAHVNTSENKVDRIYVPIKLTAGSTPIDLNRVVISVVTTAGNGTAYTSNLTVNTAITVNNLGDATSAGWYYVYMVGNNSLLEPGELVLLVLDTNTFGGQSLSAYDIIEIEIKPSEAAPAMVRYTVPATLTSEYVDLVVG